MDEFKDAVFMYEAGALPPDQQVMAGIATAFSQLPQGSTTLLQVAHNMEEAALLIDQFKAKTCGSAYSLAVLNINMMDCVEDLKFLLRGDVLGDPRTIFLASLRFMTGDIYGLAKEKVQRESEVAGRTPSCIDCYGSTSHEEVSARITAIIAAYLQEAEERAKARHGGAVVYGASPAEELLRKSQTTFYGKRYKSVRAGMSGSHRVPNG